MIYINSALVYWFSKKQTSIESSKFGSKFTAMKERCEYIRGLVYKFRMMVIIPCKDPVYIHSTLKKKSQSIAYHMVREHLSWYLVQSHHILRSDQLEGSVWWFWVAHSCLYGQAAT